MGIEYYFAYGSNLDPNQMKERVGKCDISERSYIEGYKLVFNVFSKNWNGWAANIKKTKVSSDIVYGVIYQITDEQLKILTSKYEHKEPIPISVKLENGKEKTDVKAYVWPKEESSHEPPEAYRNKIVQGLSQHGYSTNIIEKVKSRFNSP